MAIREICNYDDNGLVNIEYIEFPDLEIEIQDLITQKEEELVKIYNEIEALKARQ